MCVCVSSGLQRLLTWLKLSTLAEEAEAPPPQNLTGRLTEASGPQLAP